MGFLCLGLPFLKLQSASRSGRFPEESESGSKEAKREREFIEKVTKLFFVSDFFTLLKVKKVQSSTFTSTVYIIIDSQMHFNLKLINDFVLGKIPIHPHNHARTKREEQ